MTIVAWGCLVANTPVNSMVQVPLFQKSICAQVNAYSQAQAGLYIRNMCLKSTRTSPILEDESRIFDGVVDRAWSWSGLGSGQHTRTGWPTHHGGLCIMQEGLEMDG